MNGLLNRVGQIIIDNGLVRFGLQMNAVPVGKLRGQCAAVVHQHRVEIQKVHIVRFGQLQDFLVIGVNFFVGVECRNGTLRR